MKHIFIKMLVFILFVQFLNAQEIENKSSSDKLFDLTMVLNQCTLQTLSWVTCILYESGDEITYEQMETALGTFGVYSPMEEYQLALKYRNEMKDAFQWFTIYCDNIAIFLPNFDKSP